MKVALLVYHANIKRIYKIAWIEQFWESIVRQSFNDFIIYENCYNGENDRIFENSIYTREVFPSFIGSMNYLIVKALSDGADVVANCNVDDVYHKDWIKTELPFIKYHGFDVVSSNFSLIQNESIFHVHVFDKLDIKKELDINHNPVAHPAVLYSRRFLEENRYIPENFPFEDMMLWKRTIDNYKFKIVPENLLYHRIHDNSVCKSDNR